MRKVKVLHVHTLSVISGSGINTALSLPVPTGGPLIEEAEAITVIV